MIFIHIQTGREEVPTGQKILRRVQNILYTKLYIRTKNIYLPARTYTTVSRVNSLYYNIILLYSKSLRFFFFLLVEVSQESRKTTVTVGGAVAWRVQARPPPMFARAQWG